MAMDVSTDDERLDDGREQSTDENNQQGVTDGGQKLFHRIQGGEFIHGARHDAETDEQQAETR